MLHRIKRVHFIFLLAIYSMMSLGSNIYAADTANGAFDPNSMALSVKNDFNNDGRSDILWRDDTFRTWIWYMSGSGKTGYQWVCKKTDWMVKSTGDFNGDGFADIFWQRDDGKYVIKLMNDTGVIGSVWIGAKEGWTVKGTGDVNGDSKADILWKRDDNIFVVDLMDATGVIGTVVIGPKTDWEVRAMGDVNGDGRADILWQRNDNKFTVKLMDATGEIGTSWIGPHNGWWVAGMGDVNGDGDEDILWKKDNNKYVIKLMDADGQIGTVWVGGPSGWSARDFNDYDGDGKADILWEKNNNRHVVWLMDESGKRSSTFIGQENGSNFAIIQNPYALKKTGQTKSYNHYGWEVTDGSIKDDGYYRRGLVPGYTRDNTKEVVLDRITGLHWQDDSSVVSVTKSWSDANDYCRNDVSTGGYTNWRLPTRTELVNLNIYNGYATSMDPEFSNTRRSVYWSSTPLADHTGMEWTIHSGTGSQGAENNDSSNVYVRCVHGDSRIRSASLLRSGDMVTDNTTHLQWQDNTDAKTLTMKWQDAIDYCEALGLGNHSDWRLPNINELLSIMDDTRTNPALYSIFQNFVSSGYWSSTTYSGLVKTSWIITFSLGYSGYNDKDFDGNYVRCVRGGQ